MKKTVNIYLIIIASSLIFSCGTKESLPISKYYDYDRELPLKDTLTQADSMDTYTMQHIDYYSIHNKKVSALLSIPKNIEKPMPVVILLHGVGDRKTVDYIETGHEYFIKSGYAVFRIDIANHGDRKEDEYEVSFTDGYKYWTRDLITQTVFDLRRGIDLLSTISEIDSTRIGFYGISLGGFTGTVFCAVDKRVKVPVLALAGGGLNVMFGLDALSDEALDYVSIIDPINFVEMINPRPLLMINAENDDIVPPFLSKRLFEKAKGTKEIIWYNAKHHDVPIDKVYQDGINWYKKYL
ncbi:MAG: hypothetical protein DRI95_08035 [Bacteroidetes bacterium]|nr:MAG: hypothetical protein DRI95_08035 [Bacteroidota bacterium]RLD77894.1 MAG: hypothetical protein DRJ07_14025 [Bacteroidota bacterium]